MSISQQKHTNQSEAFRVMRPADVFEPGYDTIFFKQAPNNNQATLTGERGGIQLSY